MSRVKCEQRFETQGDAAASASNQFNRRDGRHDRGAQSAPYICFCSALLTGNQAAHLEKSSRGHCMKIHPAY